MQFDRSADGKLTPLPKPSVDTGAGLERVTAVMQGVTNNYDIDIFVDLIKEAGRLLGTTDLTNPSLRVIADHIRACSFLVVDGVIPSNEGRGYVLRRIARRAMRHGHKFGKSPTFFNELVPTLVKVMGQAFPELVEKQARVREVLLKEGEQFERTLETGMEILDAAIAKLGGGKTIDGDTVFKLHDTYGFPTDLTADIARERGLQVDMPGYEKAMQKQREHVAGRQQVRHGHEFGRQDRRQDGLPRLRKSHRTSARSWRCSRTAQAVQSLERRRRGRGRARPHSFLRGVRRPGR